MRDLNTTKLMLSLKETAALLDESQDTIREWLNKGILKGERTDGGEHGNWRIPTDCLRKVILCKSFIKRFTNLTQVFWVSWEEPPSRADCQDLRDYFLEFFMKRSVQGVVKDVDSVLPQRMNGRGRVIPEPPNDLPSSPR
jgi:hypothetical protein